MTQHPAAARRIEAPRARRTAAGPRPQLPGRPRHRGDAADHRRRTSHPAHRDRSERRLVDGTPRGRGRISVSAHSRPGSAGTSAWHRWTTCVRPGSGRCGSALDGRVLPADQRAGAGPAPRVRAPRPVRVGVPRALRRDPGARPCAAPGTAGHDGRMADPRAGQPAQPQDLVDLSHLVTAYYTGVPDPDDVDQQVAFGTSGHRGSSLKTSFNETHILATTQAICDYRREQGFDGPLFIGRDTHGLSEPAWASALEVLAANDVQVLVDARDAYTPTPARLARDHHRERRPLDRLGARRRHRGDALAQPAERRRLQVQPAARRAGRHRRHQGDRGAGQRADPRRRSRTCRRIPFERARAAVGSYDFLGAYVDDLPSVVDLAAIKEAGVRIGADPLGGASVALLGRDRRPARARADRGQPAGRRDVAVHDARLGRQDPDGLLLPVGDGVAGAQEGRVRRRDRQRRGRRPARHRHAGRRADEPEPLPRGRDPVPLRRRPVRAGRRARGSARRWCRAR